MVYSDTTNKNGILQFCEIFTDLGDGKISGNSTLKSQFTGLINVAYHKLVTMILASQDEWDFDDTNHSDFAVLSTSLVANQRDYSIPVSEKVLKIKRVDISYDGTNWYKADPFDINESGLGMGLSSSSTQESNIDARFSKSEPKYDLRSNSIWIYPRANATDVANGGKIRIEWTREIDEFTTADTTQEPGFDEPFQIMIPMEASYYWLISKDPTKAKNLKNELIEYEQRLKQYYGSKQEDRMKILKPAYINYN